MQNSAMTGRDRILLHRPGTRKRPCPGRSNGNGVFWFNVGRGAQATRRGLKEPPAESGLRTYLPHASLQPINEVAQRETKKPAKRCRWTASGITVRASQRWYYLSWSLHW